MIFKFSHVRLSRSDIRTIIIILKYLREGNNTDSECPLEKAGPHLHPPYLVGLFAWLPLDLFKNFLSLIK